MKWRDWWAVRSMMEQTVNQAIFELGCADGELRRLLADGKSNLDRKAIRRVRASIQRTLNYIAPNETTTHLVVEPHVSFPE